MRSRKRSTPCAQPGVGAFDGEIGDLVVVLAGEAERDLVAFELAGEPGHLVLLPGVPGQAEPPRVEGNRIFLGHEAEFLADGRIAAVGGHGELRANLSYRPLSGAVADACDRAAVLDQPGDGGVLPQGEGRLGGRLDGQKLKQVPLRDHRDVIVRRGQGREVAQPDPAAVRERRLQIAQPALRQPTEFLPQAELVHEPDG
ncbi:hypothetical protein GCM10022419_120080 [Nonomuraea rosea]|uniref:Uncharacterized protein n=1 Tax=Nonomuraea rosea TaxID=638574 RepID=A0ABP6ZMV5_9ACTN